MARRRRHSKIQPAELTIFGQLAAGTTVLDIGQQLSQINRKMYRQGMQYSIANIEFYAEESLIYVERLPHHWPSVNAWVKSQALWKQQQDDRLEEAGLSGTKAAHRDFKIYFDGLHAAGATQDFQASTSPLGAAGGGAYTYITLPTAQGVSATVDMDWHRSNVVVPNASGDNTSPEEFTLHMLGPDNAAGTSKGMIQAYAESRERPQQHDPNIVDVDMGWPIWRNVQCRLRF